MIDKIGGRKVLVSVLVLGIGLAADIFLKNGISSNLLALLLGIVGSYTVGNVGEHVAGAMGSRGEAPEAAPADLTPIMTELSGLQASLGEIRAGVATSQQALSFIIEKAGFKP